MLSGRLIEGSKSALLTVQEGEQIMQAGSYYGPPRC